MKTNELKELRTKSIEELKNLIKDTKESLFTIKMGIMQSKEKNLKQISMKNDDIARMFTIIKEKEMENVKSA